MNSALKPVLSATAASGPPNPTSAQLNKPPMHTQGTPATYGQTNNTMPASNLVNLPHNNTQSAPNPAHQANHYSLNVPNAYSTNTTNNQIPASNHPVANTTTMMPSGAPSAPNYSPSKTMSFVGGYQPNLGHPPNQPNPIPPVSQTLPATHTAPVAASPPAQTPTDDKPQANGTSPVKQILQGDNHIITKEKSPVPPSAAPLKPIEKSDEVTPLPTTTPTQSSTTLEQSNKQAEVVKEETKIAETVAAATPVVSEVDKVKEAKVIEDDKVAAEKDVRKESEEKLEEKLTKSDEATTTEDKSVDNNKEESTDQTAQTSPTNVKSKDQAKSKSVLTPRTPTRKVNKTGESPKASTTTTPVKNDGKSSTQQQKSPSLSTKSKRTRIPTQPYQSPLPEIEIITKISSTTPKAKNNDDKLIVFYKNEFLAVRNSEGSFYICQAVQNIYKSSPKIRIRWLSQDKNEKSGEVYTPDFYDFTDFDCILTNLNLERVDKHRYRLPPEEKDRTDSILKRSIAVEKGEASPSLTEEHPDGIDVSLYKEESQLKKRGSKRKASSSTSRKSNNNTTKSPDQPKVRKVTTAGRGSKKVAGKRGASTPGRKPAAAASDLATEKKASTSAAARTDRAKRRSDNQNHSKVSPVVDQKKAKVLAKVARKGAASTSAAFSASKSAKNTKGAVATASSSKAQKAHQLKGAKKTKKAKK